MTLIGYERFKENRRRLREYNLQLALFRYRGLDDGSEAPARPFLITPDGRELLYEPSHALDWPPDPDPVGAGPDEQDYYLARTDDGWQIGDLFHSPRTGGVYCRVETPEPDGSFAGRWLRVT